MSLEYLEYEVAQIENHKIDYGSLGRACLDIKNAHESTEMRITIL